MKKLNFIFYDERKQATKKFFSLSELGYGPLELNFIKEDSPTFDKVSG